MEQLKRALASALGRRPRATDQHSEKASPEEMGRRIDSAQQRLKSSIPPPEE